MRTANGGATATSLPMSDPRTRIFKKLDCFAANERLGIILLGSYSIFSSFQCRRFVNHSPHTVSIRNIQEGCQWTNKVTPFLAVFVPCLTQ